MGPTNIHYPAQLLERASIQGVFSDQAVVKPFGKPVLIISGPFAQEDIDRYQWCLRSTDIGTWIEEDKETQTGKVSEPDVGMEVPKMRIGPGLSRASNSAEQLRYVLVVEGRTGSRKVKVLIESGLDQVAATMLHEALNGYSTVFSAAYRPQPSGSKSVPLVGPRDALFRKVAASQAMDNNAGGVFGLIC